MKISQIFGLTVIAAALALGATTYYVTSGTGPRVISTGKALIGGTFEMTKHTGDRMTEKDLQGKYSLMMFGYTYCPDVCPTELQVVTAALDKLGKQAEKIQPVFVTIDPARDTPAIMAEYIGHFHKSFIGLSGSKEDVAKIAKAYRVYYAKAGENRSSDDYLMDHSSIMYLMSPQGEFVKHFAYTTDATKLANSLKSEINK